MSLSVPLVCGKRLSPVMNGLSVPTHEKALGTFALSGKLIAAPEQIAWLFALVIFTAGITEIVIVCGVPTHEPICVVGVTV